MRMRVHRGLPALCLSLAVAGVANGQDSADLAKTVQNPLASLVTLPFQANYNADYGPSDRTLFNLNVQPVIPFTGEKWNVISRTIIPINSVPVGETESEFGLGDATLSLFWSPAKPAKLTWGLGPIIGLPTASNPEVLGSEKLSLGPTGVVFYGIGSWTMGTVVSNLWSVAGDSDRADINMLTAQYFLNFNFGNGWALGTAPIITANWEAESGEEWTVPWGLQISKLTHFGSRPANLLIGYYQNSEHPEGAAESQVRVQVNLLFPSKAQ